MSLSLNHEKISVADYISLLSFANQMGKKGSPSYFLNSTESYYYFVPYYFYEGINSKSLSTN